MRVIILLRHSIMCKKKSLQTHPPVKLTQKKLHKNHLDVRLLQEIEQLLALLGHVCPGGEDIEHVEQDMHGGGEYGTEFVAGAICDDFIVGVN